MAFVVRQLTQQASAVPSIQIQAKQYNTGNTSITCHIHTTIYQLLTYQC